MKKLLTKGDVLIIVFFLALSLFLFVFSFSPKENLTAQIYLNGELVEEQRLSQIEKAYTVKVGECEIELDKDGVRFVSSTCKDGLCVKHAKLSKSSDTMACIPNKVVVSIIGKKNISDIVSY